MQFLTPSEYNERSRSFFVIDRDLRNVESEFEQRSVAALLGYPKDFEIWTVHFNQDKIRYYIAQKQYCAGFFNPFHNSVASKYYGIKVLLDNVVID